MSDVVVFDKTGTLTKGIFSVETAEYMYAGAEQLVLALVAGNKHPISQAIEKHLVAAGVSAHADLGNVVVLPGKGMKSNLLGYSLLAGSPSFTQMGSNTVVQELVASGVTLFTVSLAGQAVAVFGLSDTPRDEARALVLELVARGKSVMILSGDTRPAVEKLAQQVGVALEKVHAGCSPAYKQTIVRDLQRSGKRVCFVGDGTNDGPALASADVSLAISSGSEVAITAAGAVILTSDVRAGVISCMDLAFWAHRHTMMALTWAVLYNVFAVLLASGALVRVRIEPRWAGLGELASVLPVVAIAFLLKLRK